MYEQVHVYVQAQAGRFLPLQESSLARRSGKEHWADRFTHMLTVSVVHFRVACLSSLSSIMKSRQLGHTVRSESDSDTRERVETRRDRLTHSKAGTVLPAVRCLSSCCSRRAQSALADASLPSARAVQLREQTLLQSWRVACCSSRNLCCVHHKRLYAHFTSLATLELLLEVCFASRARRRSVTAAKAERQTCTDRSYGHQIRSVLVCVCLPTLRVSITKRLRACRFSVDSFWCAHVLLCQCCILCMLLTRTVLSTA